jgi:hypothetical protein
MVFFLGDRNTDKSCVCVCVFPGINHDKQDFFPEKVSGLSKQLTTPWIQT